ncbi:unnamed protein product [Effrenium voratum]|uniref:Uncharacterized protein n=1 Tax=Effrenium voratum TaxID=2562239 RepID=A0AA36I0Y7_9DINO|nr:unnamed protein product [Effrenium voratum]
MVLQVPWLPGPAALQAPVAAELRGNGRPCNLTGFHAASTSLRLGLGVGLGLVRRAKARYAPQPKLDPELMGLAMLNQESEDEEFQPEPTESPRDDDDESWVFWDEQRNPTMGSGGLPRQKTAAPLPEPLPSLTPPEPGAGDDTEDQERTFQKAYGAQPVIMDTDGRPLKVPQYSSFEEAVREFQYPAFLQAGLARKGFYFLTPVQQCALPLMRGPGAHELVLMGCHNPQV